mmetsp:Transcript_11903/g.22925  ORF Transcript_11903/g.22925 Transcript_11903/m.22925 type:complete len:280 (-) Transcript_11903:199-1038(-)
MRIFEEHVVIVVSEYDGRLDLVVRHMPERPYISRMWEGCSGPFSKFRLKLHIFTIWTRMLGWMHENLVYTKHETGTIESMLARKSLNLRGRRLRALPPQMCWSLTNLHDLFLSSNYFETLPAAIGNLVELRVLDVAQGIHHSHMLRKVPTEIKSMTKLRCLILDWNKLETVPREIGHLTDLRLLSMKHNKVVNLPEEIESLVFLNELWLDDNKLNSLPPGIKSLTDLTYIGLSQNPLKSMVHVPPELQTGTRFADSRPQCIHDLYRFLDRSDGSLIYLT